MQKPSVRNTILIRQPGFATLHTIWVILYRIITTGTPATMHIQLYVLIGTLLFSLDSGEPLISMITERVLETSRCLHSACLQKQSGNTLHVVVVIWRNILGEILISETQRDVCLQTSNLVAVTSTTMVLHTHLQYRLISLMTTDCMIWQVMFQSGVLMTLTLLRFLLSGI